MSDSVDTSVQMTVEQEKKEQMAVADFKMVTFSLAGKDYAIDIMKVKEIAKASRFTYVPNSSPFVLGVYNLRGDIIPIIDLRLFFNIEAPERKSDALENLIIVFVEEQIFGVVVDSIEKVVGIPSSTIQPPHPLFGDINIKYIYGVVESNNRLYILLDIDRIFGAHQPEVSSEQKLTLVKKTVEVEESNVEVPPVVNESKKAEPIVQKQLDIDYTFVVESLKTLKKFNVTALNEQWVRVRFNSWKEERNQNTIQLTDEKDADLFLEQFFSTATSQPWSRSYAENIYKILPENTAKQINVWNPGCGTGYEAFSLACLLKKRYPNARIRIFGHDTDLLCVSNAPLLTVPEIYAKDWYEPYLTKTVSGEQTFVQEIKDMILFEYHDCLHTNSLPNVDLIFCRDLLSFMASESQEMVLNEFGEKLKGNGLLVLGDNETLTGNLRWEEKKVGAVSFYTKL